jgi:hypothetical protein
MLIEEVLGDSCQSEFAAPLRALGNLTALPAAAGILFRADNAGDLIAVQAA